MSSRHTVQTARRGVLVVSLAGLLVAAPVAALARPAAPTERPGEEPDRRNVIMIIGDGMGYNSVDAGSLYQFGEASYQSTQDNPFLAQHGSRSVSSQVYQSFPTQVGVETGYVFSQSYDSIDAWASPEHATRANPNERLNVTDSAAAATAMSTGVRTRGGYLGWDRDENPLVDMVELASEQDMATGLVTSARFWADTPAGFVVHTEDDDTDGIISQLLYNEDLDVLIGGGHPEYGNDGTPKEAYHRYVPEAEWADLNGGPDVPGLPDWTLIDDREEFQALASPRASRGERVTVPEKLFGLAPTDGALFHDRPGTSPEPFVDPMADNIPRLDELAVANLNVLGRASEVGFFTVIEAATIDSAAHHGQLGRQIEEQVALNDTVRATVRWIEHNSSWEETTLIVTSDHETGNLWGAETLESGQFQPLTGQRGQLPAAQYTDFTDVDPEDPQRAPHYHTHQLVPLYAKGPLAPTLQEVAVGQDPVRGAYLQNTDIAVAVRELIASDD